MGLWKVFHFSSKNRHIFREIQAAYGVKTLAIVKATVTRWLSHGVACKRTRERYPIIIESLDNIISKDPKAELIGIRDHMLNPQTVLQICFLEDVLCITNILSLVLQSDCKDFSAIQRAMQLTCSQLQEMRDSIESLHFKSFNSCNEILEKIIEFEQQNVVGHMTRKR